MNFKYVREIPEHFALVQLSSEVQAMNQDLREDYQCYFIDCDSDIIYGCYDCMPLLNSNVYKV